MKTKYVIGAAIVAVLNCAAVNAQVLGGNAVGGLGGSLSGGLGGMRDINVAGDGGGHGSFGTDIGMGSLRRDAGDIAGRSTQRARGTVDSTRDRASSVRGKAHDAGKQTIGKTKDVAHQGVTPSATTAFAATSDASLMIQQIESSADTSPNASTPSAFAPSALAPSASIDGSAVDAVAEVVHQQQLAAQPGETTAPSLPNLAAHRESSAVNLPSVRGDAVGSARGEGSSRLVSMTTPAAETSSASAPAPTPNRSLDGSVSKSVGATASGHQTRFSSEAAAEGNASASKERGVSASGYAQGSSAANR